MKSLLTCLTLLSLAAAAPAAVFVTVKFDKDAFVRQLAPGENYGGAGALSISGADATMNNPTNGAFDSFISVNTGAMMTNFNNAFGAGNWVITSATLYLTENPTPGNSIFNYGLGRYQVFWTTNDNWTNGTGNPMSPTMNGICYSDEPTYTNGDVSLGVFEFSGNAATTNSLALAGSFVTNMAAGGEVGLFLTAVDSSIGYVFFSSHYGGNTNSLPSLLVSAMAQPVITAVTPSGPNLVLSATNGVANATYYVLASTNAAAPFNQWTPILTNVLATGGNFSLTLTNAAAVNALTPQFFILETY